MKHPAPGTATRRSVLDQDMDNDAFHALVSDLTAAAAAYYDSDVLLMSDAEYDAGLDSVTATLAEHPDWATDDTDALIDKVAAGQSDGGDVTHPERMLSLSKFSPGDDGKAGAAALATACRGGVVVEPKMDGLAIRAEYVSGHLTLAAARGDGSTGDDLTAQVLRGIDGLPAQLDSDWTGEVRGEVYMTEAQFAEAQALRAERGGKPFVNPRNATSGCLRKSGAENAMPLSFACYDLSSSDAATTHTERMLSAERLGFATARGTVEGHGLSLGLAITPDGVIGLIEAIEELRPTLGFDIDGAVVKADDDADRSALGEGSRTPHWAVAYKYPPEQSSSRVLDIEVRTGRTGRISLRARIEPVFVGGTTITYASLHNPSWVTDQGIGIGSKVLVERRGDVIPRVEAPLDPSVNDGIPTWTPPATCPSCGEEWDKTSLLWRCHTPACSVVGRITYFAARDCMDVEGLGETVATALVEAELVETVADLYDLDLDQWSGLVLGETSTGGVRRLGEANASKIMDSLEATKSQPFNRVITALGIRMTGRSVGRWLAREYPTMERLRAASVADVASIEKLGDVKAAHIVNGLAAMSDVIDRLAAAGVNMGEEPTDDGAAKPLAGKTFVISGAVPAGFKNRTEAQEAIEAAGGKASGSVSKNTTALITDETTTSKAKKAASLGVRVVDPDQFAALLRGEVL